MGLDMYLNIRKRSSHTLMEDEKVDYLRHTEMLNAVVRDMRWSEVLEEPECDEIREAGLIEEKTYQYLGGNYTTWATLGIKEVYWRKSNQIHNWLCKNSKVVEADRIYLPTLNDLKVLVATCDEVLKDNSKAVELLPNVQGFFFGSQDYDEWYFKDVEETKERLITFIKETEKLEQGTYFIEYYASW